MSKYYLAYGSNLNVRQMAHRCPTAEVVGSVMLPNYELNFCGTYTGYLTVVQVQGSKVPLGVWKIEEQDEKRLDMYEGYPSTYSKVYVPLKIDNDVVDAIIYVMNCNKLMKPTDVYFQTCLEGYSDFGFDADYLEEALNRCSA